MRAKISTRCNGGAQDCLTWNPGPGAALQSNHLAVLQHGNDQLSAIRPVSVGPFPARAFPHSRRGFRVPTRRSIPILVQSAGRAEYWICREATDGVVTNPHGSKDHHPCPANPEKRDVLLGMSERGRRKEQRDLSTADNAISKLNQTSGDNVPGSTDAGSVQEESMMRLLLVVAAGIGYLFIALAVLESLDILREAFGWPPWVSQVVVIVLLAGLVAVVVYAWPRAGTFLQARLARKRAQEDLAREAQMLREQVTMLQSEVDSLRREQQSKGENS